MSLAAACIGRPCKLLWSLWFLMSLHSLIASRTVPLFVASLAPWALNGSNDGSAAGACLGMSLLFFYVGYEWDSERYVALCDTKAATPATPVTSLDAVPNPTHADAAESSSSSSSRRPIAAEEI